MKRFTAICAQGFARLAFWRKPVASALDQPEKSATATDRDSSADEQVSNSVTEATPVSGSWFARLKQALHRVREVATEPVPNPDHAGDVKRPSRPPDASATAEVAPTPKRPFLMRLKNLFHRKPNPGSLEAADESKPGTERADVERPSRAPDASAPAEVAPAPKLSFLARLKNLFHRKTKPDSLEATADESKPGAKIAEAATSSGDADSVADENAEPVSGARRALALLSNKWVLISGVSGVLLAVTATVLFMLMQSTHEKEKLQAELHKTQKKLELATAAKKPKLKLSDTAPASVQANDPVAEEVSYAVTESQSNIDADECEITDKASVAQNLKSCIESFNRAMDRSRAAQ